MGALWQCTSSKARGECSGAIAPTGAQPPSPVPSWSLLLLLLLLLLLMSTNNNNARECLFAVCRSENIAPHLAHQSVSTLLAQPRIKPAELNRRTQTTSWKRPQAAAVAFVVAAAAAVCL